MSKETSGDINEQYGAWIAQNMINDVRSAPDQSVAIRRLEEFLRAVDGLSPPVKERAFGGIAVILLAFIRCAQFPADPEPPPLSDDGPRPRA